MIPIIEFLDSTYRILSVFNPETFTAERWSKIHIETRSGYDNLARLSKQKFPSQFGDGSSTVYRPNGIIRSTDKLRKLNLDIDMVTSNFEFKVMSSKHRSYIRRLYDLVATISEANLTDDERISIIEQTLFRWISKEKIFTS